MFNQPALLALANGTTYQGVSIGAEGDTVGELVFNTAMTGYQEMLTDPSYARQLLTLTAAHIGNTGCNPRDMESSRIWASGLVVRNCSVDYSNYRATISLPDWLQRQKIVAIAGVDTRSLTLLLRQQGAMNACITTKADDPERAVKLAQNFSGLDGLDLAKIVSRQTIERWHEGNDEWGIETFPEKYHVVAYDFGIKQTILRILHDLGCHLTLVPAETPAEQVLAMEPQGIFLSNGPGDPKACTYAINAAKTFMKSGVPLFGICLGFQIIGLACGAQSVKMKFGHHGANHPVVDTRNERVFITSQNHGFAIDETTLPKDMMVTHRSLFDQSLQGIRHRTQSVFGLQGHPEASPGPHDMSNIFEDFIIAMKQFNRKGV